ncbi:hypothetical protein L195_g051229 [Trifolium pratense]|uniref:Uncharacterized protein n=1 Tax=Trifolium pratense TaxID=57577 RepID=A0A2K3JYJ7_TRIPR|nr:hypothetical protein L195_g051229 [Trifolium pratense]
MLVACLREERNCMLLVNSSLARRGELSKRGKLPFARDACQDVRGGNYGEGILPLKVICFYVPRRRGDICAGDNDKSLGNRIVCSMGNEKTGVSSDPDACVCY